MRYKLYGLVPVEREANESPMTEDEQRQQGEMLIYETDDPDEARQLQAAGGYTDRIGQWYVITRVEDSTVAGGGGGGPVAHNDPFPTKNEVQD